MDHISVLWFLLLSGNKIVAYVCDLEVEHFYNVFDEN